MRDPWQDETLDGLVAYLQAAREATGMAWSVVVSSSEELATRLQEELAGRIEGLDEVELSAGQDPRRIVEERLETARAGAFRVTVLRGLGDVLASDVGEGFLTWLNFRREDFERAAEAFVFMLPAAHASTWSRLAPDLDRYTQHFECIDWEDLIRTAEDDARTLEVEALPLSKALGVAEQRLERSRELYDLEVDALVEVGRLAIELGLLERSRRALEEAAALSDRLAGSLPAKALRSVTMANAMLASHLGHPRTALEELEALRRATNDDALLESIAVEHYCLGQARRALAELDASTDGDDRVTHKHNAATIGAWLGRIRTALAIVRGSPDDLRPWERIPRAWAWGLCASLLIESGAVVEALDPLARSLRASTAVEADQPRIAALTSLASATLSVGHPARAKELLEGAPSSPGWQTARSYGLAIVRAEISRVLLGPSAVLPIVDDERERQRGWDAPIPAAELAYVRALASTDDDEARRNLQGASDRFRAMEGWYHLSELERHLARLDRLHGDLDRATARVEEGLEWHAREGLRPREARDRTELAMIALGRSDPESARNHATQALELIRACNTRLYEPAALVALAAAEHALGRPEIAAAHERRWRRLVTGIDAKGLLAVLERDAAWARAQAKA